MRGGRGGAFKYAFLQTGERITSVSVKYLSPEFLCALTFYSSTSTTYKFGDCSGQDASASLNGGLAYITGRFGTYVDHLQFWSAVQ